jgi:spore coat protein CotH
MRTLLRPAAMLLATATLASGRGATHAQAAANPFDGQVLHDVRLFINSRDLRLLRERFTEAIDFPADFVWNTTRVRNVAVRTRGLASRNPHKLPLRVDFNRYVTGQQFAGLSSIVLDNLWTDRAMIRDVVAMAFFNRMGQPAPRESFARLTINNELQGLYALVEPVDGTFVQRTTGETGGYLFEYEYARPYHAEFLGDDLEPYKAFFLPRTFEREADALLYGPIRDLLREVNRDVDASWRDLVDQRLDLDHFVTYVAIETLLAENDGFLGQAGMANFYLYRPPGSIRHRMLPWDKDTTLFFLDPDVMLRVDENELVRRALSIPALRSRYLDVLEQAARSARQDDWLASEIDRQAALIDAAARMDSRKNFTNDEFDVAVGFLREFARVRPGQVLDAVARLR